MSVAGGIKRIAIEHILIPIRRACNASDYFVVLIFVPMCAGGVGGLVHVVQLCVVY